MSAHSKNWFFRNGIANAKYASDATHAALSCTDCHGGADNTSDRAAAHTGMTAIPTAATCAGCHGATAALAASSLHTTVKGYETILADRGFNFADPTSRARYDAQCIKCHAATGAGASAAAACGQCHISVPDTAGGGLIAGHRMQRTPDQNKNCTACHGSRVKDEFTGANNALYTRNRTYSAAAAAGDGFVGTALVPDTHGARGMTCAQCHTGGEMHGQGVTADIDRYGITGRMQCTSCHASLAGSNSFHSAGHLDKMACQLCHAQPYKNCFSCHTQVTAGGEAFFTSNTTDPTRTARDAPAAAYAAATSYGAGVYVTFSALEYRSLLSGNLGHQPDTSPTWWERRDYYPAGDALIAFRAGRNPKFGVLPGAKEYAVLRHVPVDADVFAYTEDTTPVAGLLPNVTALPTWKYATPHNIVKNTRITTDPDGAGTQTACGNCHSSRYSQFWLTDGEANAYGWGLPFDVTANAGVVQAAPPAPVVSE